MTFDDIPLCEAVHDLYSALNDTSGNGQILGPGPRSDYWLKDPGRERLCRFIFERVPLTYVFRLNIDRITEAFSTYGRTGNKETYGRTELLVEVARAHGRTCFYANRGKGACSPEVTLDRLVPGVRGGQYTIENCVLACSRHNSQRGDCTLEEYLLDANSTVN